VCTVTWIVGLSQRQSLLLTRSLVFLQKALRWRTLLWTCKPVNSDMHSMDVSSGDASKPVAVGISSGDLDAYHAFDNARTASVASSHKPVSEAGMFSSIFNLSNTILGSCITLTTFTATLRPLVPCRFHSNTWFVGLVCGVVCMRACRCQHTIDRLRCVVGWCLRRRHAAKSHACSTLAACRYTGAGLFAVLLCLFGFLANFSIQLLTRSLVYTNRETYGDIGYEALGRMGEMLALGWYALAAPLLTQRSVIITENFRLFPSLTHPASVCVLLG